MRKYKALIFDMDGLMLDTERMTRPIWASVFAEFDYPFSDGVYDRVVGRNIRDAEQIFKSEYGSDFPFHEMRARRIVLFDAKVEQEGVPVKSGLFEILEFLEQHGIAKAVATSTCYETALHKLESAGVKKHFDVVVGGDQIINGKPAPDIFLAAANRLNALPTECIVLEDSASGIMAAHAGGFLPILVLDVVDPGEEIRSLAYRTCDSLTEVTTLLVEHTLLA